MIGTSAGLGSVLSSIHFNSQSNEIYLTDTQMDRVIKIDENGNISTVMNVPSPSSVRMDSEGNLYVVGSKDCTVRKMDRNGKVKLVETFMENRKGCTSLVVSSKGDLFLSY